MTSKGQRFDLGAFPAAMQLKLEKYRSRGQSKECITTDGHVSTHAKTKCCATCKLATLRKITRMTKHSARNLINISVWNKEE